MTPGMTQSPTRVRIHLYASMSRMAGSGSFLGGLWAGGGAEASRMATTELDALVLMVAVVGAQSFVSEQGGARHEYDADRRWSQASELTPARIWLLPNTGRGC